MNTHYWEQVNLIATLANDQNVNTKIDKIKKHISDLEGKNEKPKILVVGSSGAGKSSFVNVLLRHTELLPMTRIPKRPAVITVKSEASAEVVLKNSDSSDTEMKHDYSELRRLITTEETLESLIVSHSDQLLEMFDIVIANYSQFESKDEWKFLLDSSVHVFVVMQAGSLLNEDDRRFVYDVLEPAYSFDNVTFVCNQIDTVVENEDLNQVREHLEHFVKSFDPVPAIKFLSASKHLKQISEDVPFDENDEFVVIRSNLLNKQKVKSVVAEVVSRLQRSLLEYLEETLSEQRENLLAQRRGNISENADWLDQLNDRRARSLEQVTVFIDELIQDDFNARLQTFGSEAKEFVIAKLENENNANKRVIQNQLQSKLEDFLTDQIQQTQDKIIVKLEDISGMIEKDIQTTTSKLNIDPQKLFVDIRDSKFNSPLVIESPDDQDDSTIVRLTIALQLTGVALFFFARPIIALTCIGLGQFLRMFKSRSNKQSKTEVLVDAFVETIDQTIYDINQTIQREFAYLTKTLKHEIDKIYDKVIDGIASEKEQLIDDQSVIQSRIDQLTEMLDDKLPELKQNI